MALTLFNTYIAVDSIEPFSGNDEVSQGEVFLVDPQVNVIKAGDKIFFPRSTGRIIKYGDKECLVVQQVNIIGRI